MPKPRTTHHRCSHVRMVIHYNAVFALICLLSVVGIIVASMIRGLTLNDGFLTVALLTPMTMALGNVTNLVTKSQEMTPSGDASQVQVVNPPDQPIPVSDQSDE